MPGRRRVARGGPPPTQAEPRCTEAWVELTHALVGNGAANTLDGAAGHHRLTGGRGRDRLVGGTGNDVPTGGVLTGGRGRDLLTAGSGRDAFVCDDRATSASKSTADSIADCASRGSATGST